MALLKWVTGQIIFARDQVQAPAVIKIGSDYYQALWQGSLE